MTPGRNDTSSAGLYITECLRVNNYKKCQEKSLVYLPGDENIWHYSGYITVNTSNLFFWYFRSLNNQKTAPIILYIGGAVGVPALTAALVTNGPFRVTTNLTLEYVHSKWIEDNHVIYLENPVGQGYSYTENYVRTTDQNGQQLLSALRQFFQLFPSLLKNDLFILGSTYACKFGTSLASKIIDYNKNVKREIRLKGLAVANAWCNPAKQINYAKFLHNFGLIDSCEEGDFYELQNNILTQIRRNNYTAAFLDYVKLITPSPVLKTLYQNVTGYQYTYNVLQDKEPSTVFQTYFNVYQYLNLAETKRALHVDQNQAFKFNNPNVTKALIDDILRSSSPLILRLLENSVNVLFYDGNLNVISTFAGRELVLRTLDDDNYGPRYECAPRHKLHYDNGRLAGYVKEVDGYNDDGKLSHILIRNTGQLIDSEKPSLVHFIISNFVNDLSNIPQ